MMKRTTWEFEFILPKSDEGRAEFESLVAVFNSLHPNGHVAGEHFTRNLNSDLFRITVETVDAA